ncbi:Phosphoenolpyruvate-dependent phosphotransferase system [Thalassocella blandensis]|nr:Phosphoenolpyruvate-dependent phosphotransferase system [Thalassocella blandensis]
MNIMSLTRIVQEVAFAGSPTDQVKLIVDSISESLDVDVCTLYRINADQNMELLASHGLSVKNKDIKIPAGKGLVGLVVKSRHAVNIDDAAKHPDYFYIPEINEEKYTSFCGVPLVRFGKVIGALVVQSKQLSKLEKESEAVLTTLASQLALIVAELPAAISTSVREATPHNIRVNGNKGAPGIGIGKAVVCIGDDLSNVVDAACDNVDAALVEWRELLEKVKLDIEAERASLKENVSESIRGIFDAYSLLLSDQSLINKVEAELKAGHWLPWAIKHSIHYFVELFSAMTDPYLKARCEDILHLGNKLYFTWRGKNPHQDFHDISEPVVLIGEHIDVSLIASVPSQYLAGVVCFGGATLSHTAILANAMGIPAVMGVGAIKQLKDQQNIIVVGDEGIVIVNPTDAISNEFNKLQHRELVLQQQLDSLRDMPAVTRDGVRVSLFTNTGLLVDLTPGIEYGAEGIGLYRTEIPFMVRESFPSEDEQIAVYRRVLKAYEGKPVYMRTLDIGGDKQLPYYPIDNEDNPALGWRGIRFTLDNIQLLMTQVRAMILAAEQKTNLHILLPMVSSTGELDEFISVLNDAVHQLKEEGHAVCKPKIGVMVEVPAVISLLPFWKKKINFVSIGTNDLSQYLLALDRNNARVASRFDHLHPAVIQEIKRILSVAKSCELPVSLCGEMASEPLVVALLLGLGVRNLSMSANKIPKIKYLIRSLDMVKMNELAEQILQSDSVEQIRHLLEQELNELGLTDIVYRKTVTSFQ